ncbi:MAG: FecR domain-containing protein, partial [Acidiferrobacterales bacterium]|nr:FecR domain-containing protein [Acidiferrobacterales bacterium]
MSSVEFPNMELAVQAAAEWIAKIDRGLNSEEEIELAMWLEASPVHGDALVKCASMWDLLDLLSPIAKLVPIEALEAKLGEEKEGITASIKEPESFAESLGAGRKTFWLMAATILVLIAGSIGYQNLTIPHAAQPLVVEKSSDTQRAANERRYKTAVGEMSMVTLTDGSILQLNTNSEVLVRYSDTTRYVELLSGEVYFDVAKDPNKPFAVKVGNDQVL